MERTNSTTTKDLEGDYDESSFETVEVVASDTLKAKYNGFKKPCTSSNVFHKASSSIFILTAMTAMGAAGYFTVVNTLNQGILSQSLGAVTRSNAELLSEMFLLSNDTEQRAYLETLWYFNMFAVCFGVWVFAVIRSMEATPQWAKVVAYSTCIPLTVICQWITNTCDLYMYLDFIGSGAVQNFTSTLRVYFQYASWSFAGLSILAILISFFIQARKDCRS